MTAQLRNRRAERIARRLENFSWAWVILWVICTLSLFISYALSKVI